MEVAGRTGLLGAASPGGGRRWGAAREVGTSREGRTEREARSELGRAAAGVREGEGVREGVGVGEACIGEALEGGGGGGGGAEVGAGGNPSASLARQRASHTPGAASDLLLGKRQPFGGCWYRRAWGLQTRTKTPLAPGAVLLLTSHWQVLPHSKRTPQTRDIPRGRRRRKVPDKL